MKCNDNDVNIKDGYEVDKAFKNAIQKGMSNTDDWMYMYSKGSKDYFKHYYTRNYTIFEYSGEDEYENNNENELEL